MNIKNTNVSHNIGRAFKNEWNIIFRDFKFVIDFNGLNILNYLRGDKLI